MGYTLLMGETAQLVIAPYVYKTLSYDTVKDLAPVALMITAPLVLVSSAKTSQIKTLDSLIREAKAHPGKLDYGSSGIGSLHHIAMETMKADLGISLTHIPYKGAPLAISALLAGEVPLIFTTVSSLGQNKGQTHILAVSSKDRYPVWPDIPSISEVTKGYDFSSQMGVLAPVGTSPEVLAKLSDAIKTAIHSPDFLEKLKTMSFTMTWGAPEEYAENIHQNLAKYARAVKLANIQPE
jgi:tripartite-type tricarboxylate transporter receptor subunit TctC